VEAEAALAAECIHIAAARSGKQKQEDEAAGGKHERVRGLGWDFGQVRGDWHAVFDFFILQKSGTFYGGAVQHQK
jgi:hypothetical protein